MVDDAVARLQIDARAGSEVRRLSGGNQQKVTIARWVAGGVRTMLCFDPTRGIDIRTKQQIYSCSATWLKPARRCSSTRRSSRRSSSSATAPSSSSAARSSRRSRAPTPTKPTLLRAAYNLRSGAQLPEELVAAETDGAVAETAPDPAAEPGADATNAAMTRRRHHAGRGSPSAGRRHRWAGPDATPGRSA